VTGLKGDIDENETTLLERINARLKKKDPYTDFTVTAQYIEDYYK